MQNKLIESLLLPVSNCFIGMKLVPQRKEDADKKKKPT